MTVFVNNKELTLFEGAKVKDALRMYDSSVLKKVKAGTANVCDSHGNELDIDGALNNGSRLTVNRNNK